jgi:hypothetical protein
MHTLVPATTKTRITIVSSTLFVLIGMLLYTFWPRSAVLPSEKLLEKGRPMLEAYLHGNIATARQSLHAAIQLFESDNDSSSTQVRAAALFILSGQLYTLEKKTGNPVAANLALIRAQYWNLRRFELDSFSMGLNQRRVQEFYSITPEKIMEMIEKIDREKNRGMLAKYNNEIENK